MMPRQMSRKIICVCISGVVSYMTCFLFLWNKALNWKSTSAYHSSKSWSASEFSYINSTKSVLPMSRFLFLNQSKRFSPSKRLQHYNQSTKSTESPISTESLSAHQNKSISVSLAAYDRQRSYAKRFYLSTVIMVRIYSHDLAKWTIKELKQWLYYLFYAGVEHVYLCDHFVYHRERLKSSLLRYEEKGLLTYIDWPWNASQNSGKIMRHQVNCYSHVIHKYGRESEWQLSIDMDEYPFCLKDMDRSFLSRYLANQPATVSQILMPNFLMLGQGNRLKTMTIERITRITKEVANALTKPVYKTGAILRTSIHKHSIKSGLTVHASPEQLRMLHYWGARLQKWGPDTNKTFEITNEYVFVRDHIASSIRNDLLLNGEIDAFSNSTGP